MGKVKTGIDGEGQGKACPPETLAKMREDYALIVADRKANHGWSDADAEELGRYIADAKANAEATAAWSLYLATEAAVIRRRNKKS